MRSQYDMDKRKSVHLKLMADTYTELRIASIRYKVSIQEMFEEFASRVVDSDPVFMKILDDLKQKIRDRKVIEFSRTDSDTIYNLIDRLNQERERSTSNDGGT